MNNIVQSLWIGDNLCVFEQICIKSYLKLGYEFHLYLYNKEMTNIPNNTIVKDANEIIDEKHIFEYEGGGVSAFSNLFRYKLLYEKGGIWVDMDMICLKKLDFDNTYIFSSEYKNNKIHVNVGFLKCPVKSKLMNLCYLNCKSLSKQKNLRWGDLGPKLFKKYVFKLKLNKYIKTPETFCPIPYIDFKNIININILNTDIYCIHIWNQCWNRNELDKNIILNNKYFKQIYDYS